MADSLQLGPQQENVNVQQGPLHFQLHHRHSYRSQQHQRKGMHCKAELRNILRPPLSISAAADHSLITEFPPLQIHTYPKGKPVTIPQQVSIPAHWQAQVKKELDCEVQLDVIELVPEPTAWCSRKVLQ